MIKPFFCLYAGEKNVAIFAGWVQPSSLPLFHYLTRLLLNSQMRFSQIARAARGRFPQIGVYKGGRAGTVVRDLIRRQPLVAVAVSPCRCGLGGGAVVCSGLRRDFVFSFVFLTSKLLTRTASCEYEVLFASFSSLLFTITTSYIIATEWCMSSTVSILGQAVSQHHGHAAPRLFIH